MNRPQLGPLCMATARAIAKSPDNIMPLPWVALAMNISCVNDVRQKDLTLRECARIVLDDSRLIPGY